jgi:hypothetical protein
MQIPTKNTLLTIALVPGILVTAWIALSVFALGGVGVAESRGVSGKNLVFLQLAGIEAILVGLFVILPIKLSKMCATAPAGKNWLWILSLALAYLPALVIATLVFIGILRNL